jgi:MotA/TolQ/ExbB proton channel family
MTSTILLSSFIGLHIEGGVPFMFPLLILLVINIGIIIYVLIATLQAKQINSVWIESIRRIATLAAAWGAWSTLIGLLFAFSALETSPEPVPFPVICGGLKVALLTVLYGLIIFCVSYVAYIVLKIMGRKVPV